MPKVWTLGTANRKTRFNYAGNVNNGATLLFPGKPYISAEFFKAVLTHFNGQTVPGGFSMTDPTPGGLGQWVQENSRQLNGTGGGESSYFIAWETYMSKTILILAANPKNTTPLRLDQEVREIGNGLERAQKRDAFTLKEKFAVRPIDVRRAMLDYKPAIVHFCGHGSGEEGIVFEDESGQAKLVEAYALAEFFSLFSNKLECVVLNACYSEVQADAIAKHIPCVIGMSKAIGDVAAIEFAVAFYDAIGAGESYDFAYKLACNAIKIAGIPEQSTPVIKQSATALPAREKTEEKTQTTEAETTAQPPPRTEAPVMVVVDSSGVHTRLRKWGIVYRPYASNTLDNAFLDGLIIERGKGSQTINWSSIAEVTVSSPDTANIRLSDSRTIEAAELRSGTLVGIDEFDLSFSLGIRDLQRIGVSRV